MSATPVHHSINYVELAVTDLDAAKSFYGQAFGWTFTDYGEMYVGFTAPGSDGDSGGFVLAENARPHGGPFVILFSTDLDRTADLIVAAGGAIVEGPYDFPGGRRLHFHDPSGNELGVWAEE